MSKKFLVIVLIVSVTINLVAVFTLGYYWWEISSHKKHLMPRLIERIHDWRESPLRHELNLTEEQIAALNKNQEEMKSEMLPFRQELFAKRRDLVKLLEETEPNKEKADSLFKEIVSLQMKLESHVFNNLWHIRSILTPEQRGKLEFLIHEFFEANRPPPYQIPPEPPLPGH